MNEIYGYRLANLNEVRANEPGLDLGDKIKRVGIQVTSDKTSSKVNETLKKITDEQKKDYDKFIILILGTKQTSYAAVEKELAKSLNFSINRDILDFQDLEKEIVGLKTEHINKLYEFLSRELIKVYGELGADVTPSGEPTSILSSLEEKPNVSYTNCNELINFMVEKYGIEYSGSDAQENFQALKDILKCLMELPKITREFYYALVSRATFHRVYDQYCVKDEVMKRIINIPPDRYYEEIKLLTEVDLISYSKEDEYTHLIRFSGLSNNLYCLGNILDFVEAKEIDLKDVLINLNFSYFEQN